MTFSDDDSLMQLELHLKEINGWSGRVSFADMRSSKGLLSIYIELDTFLMPLRTHIDQTERNNVIPLEEALFANSNHSVVLGQPGAGKTTSMKKLCMNYFSGQSLHGYNFPIVLNLREMKGSDHDSTIQRRLMTIFPYKLTVSDTAKKAFRDDEIASLATELLAAALDELKLLVILEGFDEIQTSELKESILRELRTLTSKLEKTKLVITCRTGEFNYSLHRCDVFEISPLSSQQIATFAEKWIGHENAMRFLEDMRRSPFWDTAIKPLSLAHLCAIYERIGSIPDRPKTVYRKVVTLLLEEWDEQRSIKRMSQYSSFEADRKFEFLTHLSFFLTVNGRSTAFSQEQLVEAYISICRNFHLPEDQATRVASEIETHTGLFVQSGFRKYEFVHKSLQEYLSAEYIVKLPSFEIIANYIDILGAELAVAVSISSNPSLYLADLVLRTLAVTKVSSAFYDALLSRIVLERPDFYPCDEIVLAAFSILNAHKHQQAIIEFMKNTLTSSDVCGILKYYRLIGSDGKFFVLHRKKVHTRMAQSLGA